MSEFVSFCVFTGIVAIVAIAGFYRIIRFVTHPPQTKKDPMTQNPVEFYQDAKNEWRWRVTAANNKIVGASSEGFVHLHDARANLFVLVSAMFNVALDAATITPNEEKKEN